MIDACTILLIEAAVVIGVISFLILQKISSYFNRKMWPKPRSKKWRKS